jgi:hypothetical protein
MHARSSIMLMRAAEIDFHLEILLLKINDEFIAIAAINSELNPFVFLLVLAGGIVKISSCILLALYYSFPHACSSSSSSYEDCKIMHKNPCSSRMQRNLIARAASKVIK